MTTRALIGNITIYHTEKSFANNYRGVDIALLSNNVRAIMFKNDEDAKLYAEQQHLDIIIPYKYDGLIVNLSEFSTFEEAKK